MLALVAGVSTFNQSMLFTASSSSIFNTFLAAGIALPLFQRYMIENPQRDEIAQIDLVINWKQLKGDNICRHLRITNRLGEERWVAIHSLRPKMHNRKPSGIH